MKTWEEVISQPAYQNLDTIQRNKIRDEYYQVAIVPQFDTNNIPDTDREKIKNEFYSHAESVDPLLKQYKLGEKYIDNEGRLAEYTKEGKWREVKIEEPTDPLSTFFKEGIKLGISVTAGLGAPIVYKALDSKKKGEQTPEDRFRNLQNIGRISQGEELKTFQPKEPFQWGKTGQEAGIGSTIEDVDVLIPVGAGRKAVGIAGKGIQQAGRRLVKELFDPRNIREGRLIAKKIVKEIPENIAGKEIPKLTKETIPVIQEAKKAIIPEVTNPLKKDLIENAASEGNKDAVKVFESFEKSKKEIADLQKLKFSDIKEGFVRYVIDVDGNVKKALRKIPGPGDEAVIMKDAIRGASGRSEMILGEMEDDIYGGLGKIQQKIKKVTGVPETEIYKVSSLSKNEEDIMNQIALSKRIIEINKNELELSFNARIARQEVENKITDIASQISIIKDNLRKDIKNKYKKSGRNVRDYLKSIDNLKSQKASLFEDKAYLQTIEKKVHLHPDNLTGTQHIKGLESIYNKNPERYMKLADRANRYNAALNTIPEKLYKSGILSKTQYDNIIAKGIHYSPRRFKQYLDPDAYIHQPFLGKKITVGESGMKALDEGSIQALEVDTRKLLYDHIARTESRIARNEANKKLIKVAETENNGLLRIMKENEKLKPNEDIITAMVDGNPIKMVAEKKFTREWIESDPQITRPLANIVEWLTLAKIRRMGATGILAPEFAPINMLRDISHIFISIYEYSDNPIKYGFQIGKDMGKVFKDALLKTGRAKEFVMEGGSMNYLSRQGRFSNKYLQKLQSYLGFVNEFSERWTRLALRERALKNISDEMKIPIDKLPKEAYEKATHIATNYMDFRQGGSITKTIDHGIPYLNAAIVGTRGIFRAAGQHPARFAKKLGSLGILASGLYYANKFVNPEAYNQVSDRDKVNSFVITTPWKFRDKDGNDRHLIFTIPKDQNQKFLCAIFENISAVTIGEKVNMKQIGQALSEFSPVGISSIFPATGDALAAYLGNVDTWTWEHIWKNTPIGEIEPSEEYKTYTNPAFVGVGKALNVSPERMQRALQKIFGYRNMFTDLVGIGTRAIFDELPYAQRETAMEDTLRQIPVIRKFLRTTDPITQYEKDIETETRTEKTRLFKQKRDIQNIAEIEHRQGFPWQGETSEKYISSQPQEDQDKLGKQYEYYRNTAEMSDRRWWNSLRFSPANIRGELFYKRWVKETPQGRDRLMANVEVMKGFATDAFWEAFYKMKK